MGCFFVLSVHPLRVALFGGPFESRVVGPAGSGFGIVARKSKRGRSKDWRLRGNSVLQREHGRAQTHTRVVEYTDAERALEVRLSKRMWPRRSASQVPPNPAHNRKIQVRDHPPPKACFLRASQTVSIPFQYWSDGLINARGLNIWSCSALVPGLPRY
jgi:hypothetical protein